MRYHIIHQPHFQRLTRTKLFAGQDHLKRSADTDKPRQTLGAAGAGQQALPVRERILAGPLGRTLLFKMAAKRTEQKPHGNYPAAPRILSVIETGLAQGRSSGYEAEARAFGQLAMTPQSQALRPPS